MYKRNRIAIIPIFSLILAMALTLLTGCGCSYVERHIFEEGNFIVYDNDADTICLIGVSNNGLDEDILIVPEFIRGQRVRSIGANSKADEIEKKYGAEHVMFNSNKLKRVYIPFEIEVALGSQFPSVIGEKANCVVIIMYVKGSYFQSFRGDFVKVSAKCFFEETTYHREEGITNYSPEEVNPANVTYYYNFEDAINDGVYWVDDYDGELISYVPRNPVRLGYIFAGWYKERECINEWDFSNDVVPKKVFNEEADGSTTYNFYELKLYAKWERK